MPDSTPGGSRTRKPYRGSAVEVSFDGARCRHAAECLRGLPPVFDLSRRPWILPDDADPDDVVRVVARCPTGALRTRPITSTSETIPCEVWDRHADVHRVYGRFATRSRSLCLLGACPRCENVDELG